MANDPMQVSVSSEVLNWLHGMYDDDFVGKVLRSGEHSVEDGGVLLIKVGKSIIIFLSPFSRHRKNGHLPFHLASAAKWAQGPFISFNRA